MLGSSQSTNLERTEWCGGPDGRQVIRDGRPCHRSRRETQRRHVKDWAAAGRAVQQAGQLPPMALAAVARETGDQGEVVNDVTAHAGTADRCVASAFAAVSPSTANGSRWSAPMRRRWATLSSSAATLAGAG